MSSEEYEVEKIVHHQIINKSKKKPSFKYLIKWLNYDDDENTWERADNLNCIDLVEKYWDTVPDNNPNKITYKKLFPSKTALKPLVVANQEESSSNSIENATVTSAIEKECAPEKRMLDEENDIYQNAKRAKSDHEPLVAKKIKLLVNKDDSSSSLYTVDSSSEEEDKSVQNQEEEEDIVFDDKFGLDRKNWQELAEKIEYIGREVEGSPLFCLLKWNDGIRSMHPLTLVREKCPQLVIDAFVDLVNENK